VSHKFELKLFLSDHIPYEGTTWIRTRNNREPWGTT